jgi:cytochrome c553
MRMLAKDPGLRPEMDEIVSLLRGAEQDAETTTRPIDEVEQARLERVKLKRQQRVSKAFLAAASIALVALVAGAWTGAEEPTRRTWSPPVPGGRLAKLEEFAGLEQATIALGQALYQSPALSAPYTEVTCARCHPVAGYGTTVESVTTLGTGWNEEPGERCAPKYNTPSCVVASLQYRQQWTAGTPTLEEIVAVPLFNPDLMDGASTATKRPRYKREVDPKTGQEVPCGKLDLKSPEGVALAKAKEDWEPVLGRLRAEPELVDLSPPPAGPSQGRASRSRSPATCARSSRRTPRSTVTSAAAASSVTTLWLEKSASRTSGASRATRGAPSAATWSPASGS